MLSANPLPSSFLATPMHAVVALWKREVLKFVRDRSRLAGTLIQTVGFWLLLGLGFQGTFQLQQAADIGYMEYLFPGALSLLVLFTAIFSTISIVEERQTGFLQAVLVAPTSRLALVFGNALGGTTLALLQALPFLLVLPLVGYQPTLVGVLLTLLLLTCAGLAFTALGLIMAWRLETTRGFHAIMNVVLMPLWFLSGAVFPIAGAHPILQFLMYANPVTYLVSGLRTTLYWPQPDPLAVVALPIAVLISLAVAAVLLLLGAWVVRQPLYANA